MKRLYKSRKNKVIDGVCGGIAEYFEVDPVMVRILFVLFLFLGGSAFIAYIVGMIIIPKAPENIREEKKPAEASEDKMVDTNRSESVHNPASTGALVVGILLVLFGGLAIMDNFHLFNGIFWWIRHNFWEFIIPGFIIAAGAALIIRGAQK